MEGGECYTSDSSLTSKCSHPLELWRIKADFNELHIVIQEHNISILHLQKKQNYPEILCYPLNTVLHIIRIF